MLTLKIMSGKDKNYRIIGGIKEIKFCRILATKYECGLFNLSETPKGKVWTVCVAECTFPDTDISSTYLLTGYCYVLNNQGQTVDTYRPENKLVTSLPKLVDAK
jgi:hypothetical protein